MFLNKTLNYKYIGKGGINGRALVSRQSGRGHGLAALRKRPFLPTILENDKITPRKNIEGHAKITGDNSLLGLSCTLCNRLSRKLVCIRSTHSPSVLFRTWLKADRIPRKTEFRIFIVHVHPVVARSTAKLRLLQQQLPQPSSAVFGHTDLSPTYLIGMSAVGEGGNLCNSAAIVDLTRVNSRSSIVSVTATSISTVNITLPRSFLSYVATEMQCLMSTI